MSNVPLWLRDDDETELPTNKFVPVSSNGGASSSNSALYGNISPRRDTGGQQPLAHYPTSPKDSPMDTRPPRPQGPGVDSSHQFSLHGGHQTTGGVNQQGGEGFFNHHETGNASQHQPKKTKAGEVVDIDNVWNNGGRTSGQSNAPVHLLKRLQKCDPSVKQPDQSPSKSGGDGKRSKLIGGGKGGEASVGGRKGNPRSSQRTRRVSTGSSEPEQTTSSSLPSKNGGRMHGDEAEQVDQPLTRETGRKPVVMIGVNTGIESQRTAPGEESNSVVEITPPEPLTDKQLEEWRDVIALIGHDAVAKLVSGRWQHRLCGVRDDAMELWNAKFSRGGYAKESWALISVARQALEDAVVQVYMAGVQLLSTMLTAPGLSILPEVLSGYAGEHAAVLQALISRMKDSNSKVKDATVEILSGPMVKSTAFGGDMICDAVVSGEVVAAKQRQQQQQQARGGKVDSSSLNGHSGASTPSAASAPSEASSGAERDKGKGSGSSGGGGGSSWKSLLTRMDVVARLASDYPFSTAAETGLSVKNAMTLALAGMASSNAKVRNKGVALTAQLYKKYGGECVDPFLVGVKPATLKLLKQDIELEMCDVAPLASATLKVQEDEDLAMMAEEGAPEISEEQQAEVGLLALALELPSAQCIYSKKWKLRERLLERLSQRVLVTLESMQSQGARGAGSSAFTWTSPEDKQQVASGVNYFIYRGVHDSVPAVVTAALSLLRSALPLMAYLQQARDLHANIRATLPTIVKGTYSTVPFAQTATQVVSELAAHQSVGVSVVGPVLCSVPQLTSLGDKAAKMSAAAGAATSNDGPVAAKDVAKVPWKLISVRLNLLTMLIPVHKFSRGGFAVDDVLYFSVSMFQHPQGKVRSAAVAVILEVYKCEGNVVQAYLSNVKPALLEELKEKIDAIAKRDRSGTAPIKRLANMVQPLTRPSTFGTVENAEGQQTSGASLRHRIAHARRMVQTTEEAFVGGSDSGRHSEGGGGDTGCGRKANMIADEEEEDVNGDVVGVNRRGNASKADPIIMKKQQKKGRLIFS